MVTWLCSAFCSFSVLHMKRHTTSCHAKFFHLSLLVSSPGNNKFENAPRTPPFSTLTHFNSQCGRKLNYLWRARIQEKNHIALFLGMRKRKTHSILARECFWLSKSWEKRKKSKMCSVFHANFPEKLPLALN
jgi:hypothetical protein